MMKIGNRTLALACAVLTTTAQDAPFVTKPDVQTAGAQLQPYFQYVVDDGLISFATVKDARGRTLGSLAVESGPAGSPGKLAEAKKYFRTPTDLARVLAQYGGASGLPGGYPEGNASDCDNAWAAFRAEVLSFGYTFSFLSKSDGPSAGTGHWFSSGGFSAGFYELHGRADDVSAFFLKIQFCYEDPVAPPAQGSNGSSVDPEIFLYFRVGNAPWNLVGGAYQLEEGEQFSFWWHPVAEPLLGVNANQLDFKVALYDAAPDDRFHIGATWSKPFDTFKGN